jgi:uncharacterized protein with NAD-binding domain and iron-sulfur cluster
MSSAQDRPKFLYPPGSVLMHSPLALKRAQMFGFWVQGDLSTLQRSVDHSLNLCTQGQMQFQVLSPFVMLTFTDVSHANSLHPSDQAKGWGQETDIITWVMVGKIPAGNSEIEHVYFYPMHIWVNDAMALINGRELYGYPKYECTYTMPASVDAPLRFSLAAKGFQPFSPDTELASHPLLEVSGSGKARPIAGLVEWLEEMLTFLRSLPGFWHFGEGAWKQMWDMLHSPRVDQLFLKQFPDSAGEYAVYQAIVTAPAAVQKIHSMHLYDQAATVNLHAFDSFPLNQSLGWSLGEQPALMPFAVNFDFVVTPGTELVDNSVVKRKKIAILGGGVGAMVAAFWLTNQPDWINRYEIDVYQMGWRIGGKGASGRNADYGQRIEEHGLHIWFGFYDNAFDVMQQAYAELDRPAGSPLRTWDEAFKPHQFISLAESLGPPGPDVRSGPWAMWNIDVPLKPGQPGGGHEDISLWSAISTALAWLRQWFRQLRAAHLPTPAHAALSMPEDKGSWLHRLAEEVDGEVAHLAADVHHTLDAFERFIVALPEAVDDHHPTQHTLLRDALRALRAWAKGLISDELAKNDALRRLWIMIDLAATCMVGMLEDGVLTQGFEAINDIDFYAWLKKHGADPRWTVYSAPVRGFYDLVFAYENGDFSKPNIEAGTMLRGMMKVAMCYHGGIMYKMQAGMGDTVFTPIYQVLQKRGVRFHFFHKALSLAPESVAPGQAAQVGRIVLQQQVKLVADYQPFVSVNGLDCWPSAPNWQYLDPAQAALLQEHEINLESHWSTWPEVYRQTYGESLPERTLVRGVDFDLAIYGLSVASLAEVAAPLLPLSQALQACSDRVQAVATQAYQVWMNKDIAALGWTARSPGGQEPVLSAFSEPFDTWAPMDQLLPRESWSAALQPRSISYFCSAMPLDSYAPADESEFPKRMADQAKANAIGQLQQQISPLWPNAGTPVGFDWSALIDPDNGVGPARFDRQYWRANIDPSERYVVSLVGSSRYRLRADQSGISNLYLAGDWLKTGLDAGCVEAATMGGMQAARAICSYPAKIRGEDF